jgi:hypothetical protein
MCEHGFIGACAECDGCGQQPDYDIAECGGCGEMTPVCCDTSDGPYCSVCCPRRPHKCEIWAGKSVAGGTYERCD